MRWFIFILFLAVVIDVLSLNNSRGSCYTSFIWDTGAFIFFLIGTIDFISSVFHKGERLISFGEHNSKGNWVILLTIGLIFYGIGVICR
jgi:hypothetical protein